MNRENVRGGTNQAGAKWYARAYRDGVGFNPFGRGFDTRAEAVDALNAYIDEQPDGSLDVRKGGPGRPPGSTNGTGTTSGGAGTAVAAYVDLCLAGAPPKPKPKPVAIGKLDGHPATSTDPEAVRAAAATCARKALADDTGTLDRIRWRQRSVSLLDAADELEAFYTAPSPRDLFVKHALGWAEAQKPPISYAVFRDMGVPADAFREAGFHG